MVDAIQKYLSVVLIESMCMWIWSARPPDWRTDTLQTSQVFSFFFFFKLEFQSNEILQNK